MSEWLNKNKVSARHQRSYSAMVSYGQQQSKEIMAWERKQWLHQMEDVGLSQERNDIISEEIWWFCENKIKEECLG